MSVIGNPAGRLFRRLCLMFALMLSLPWLAQAGEGFAPVTNPNLALGLAPVNDWSVEQPFLDVMKTARPWVAHLPGQWGGWGESELRAAGALDAQGWPTRIPPEVTAISTLILTDLPEDAGGVAGRYILTWQGRGELQVTGRARIVARAPGRMEFYYKPGEGAVILTIAATDPADPIRALTVVREDRAAALAEGDLFNPDWLARIRGVRLLRFMDWMATNDSTIAHPGDRPMPDDYSWARRGVPLEVIAALADTLGADPWINVPHMADDALVREMARVMKDRLDPARTLWLEYSNEVWNWQFAQARWADAQALARWGQKDAWVQFYALRAAEVMRLWAGAAGEGARLNRVIATQTGWFGLEGDILEAPLVLAEGGEAPSTAFDSYAITGYVSGALGGEGKAPVIRGWLAESLAAAQEAGRGLAPRAADAFVAAHRFDRAIGLAAAEIRDGSVTGDRTDSLADVLGRVFPYHAGVAARHGLRLVMYEGGSHVTGIGALVDDDDLTAFFTTLNYSPQMGEIYRDLLAGWARVTDAPFNAYLDVQTPGKWGSWGALRHLGDDNPRWRALSGACLRC